MLDPFRLIRPLLYRLDAEDAHRLTIALLRRRLVPAAAAATAEPSLAVPVLGRVFANPLGLAAGFDKNAEAVDALLGLGFGFVEVGTVTPRPQAGNPRPRLFRLVADRAVINRMGFNNDGVAVVAGRLAARREAGRPGIVGANVGPNRDAADPARDCAEAARALAPVADYVVINVSSPNTPGLRDLQRRADLARLLEMVLAARPPAAVATPLLVKIAPDTTAEARAAIAEVAVALGIDGLIATNTTTARPCGLIDPQQRETGGLSGRPLLAPATAALADLAAAVAGRMPLIGVGGVASAADAWAKIDAGASLLQLYTALVFDGPALVGRINQGLADRLRRQPGGGSLAALLASRAGRAGGPSAGGGGGGAAAAEPRAGTAP